jgi:hypothetical protein
MAGSNTCFSLVRGRAMRVTRLDGCGSVDLGPDSSIVSDGFITVQLTAQTDEGETISVTNAAGKVCILDEPCPVFTGYEVQVEFCGVDPLLYELMTGMPSVTDAEGNRVGIRMNSGIDACGSGFALEVWSSVPSAVCDPNAGVSFGYFLVPFIKGGVIGDFTIGNDAVNFTLSGAKSKDGNNWAEGPYDVVKDDAGAAGPLLEPVDSRDHLWMQLTTVPPPEPSCDAVAVGVPATGATAGTPGTATPSPAYFPDDFAALDASSITASPTTAWTAGQYIVLDDGTFAHWTGTDWATGKA